MFDFLIKILIIIGVPILHFLVVMMICVLTDFRKEEK